MVYIAETVGYDGSVFSDFYAAQGDHGGAGGPGWFVWGRNSEKYGTNAAGKGLYVKLVAWPDRPRRYCRNYNGKQQCGWRTMREAQAIADSMNGKGLKP